MRDPWYYDEQPPEVWREHVMAELEWIRTAITMIAAGMASNPHSTAQELLALLADR